MKQFLAEHQIAIVAVLVPLLSAVLTAIFYPRTSEDFLRYGVRVGGLMKVFAGILVDSPKAANAVANVIFAPTPKERAKALASLVAAVTWDPRKVGEGVYQLVTGRDLRMPPPPTEPPEPPPANDNGDPPIPPVLEVGGAA